MRSAFEIYFLSTLFFILCGCTQEPNDNNTVDGDSSSMNNALCTKQDEDSQGNVLAKGKLESPPHDKISAVDAFTAMLDCIDGSWKYSLAYSESESVGRHIEAFDSISSKISGPIPIIWYMEGVPEVSGDSRFIVVSDKSELENVIADNRRHGKSTYAFLTSSPSNWECKNVYNIYIGVCEVYISETTNTVESRRAYRDSGQLSFLILGSKEKGFNLVLNSVSGA